MIFIINFLIILIFIISIIFIIVGLYSMNKAHNIRIEKDEEYQKQNILKQQLEDKIQQLYKNKTELDKILEEEKQKIDEICEKEKNKISEQLKIFQQNADYASTKYFEQIEDAYDEVEIQYKNKVANLQSKEQQVQDNIKDAEGRYNAIIDQINAATKAQLREREREEKLDFYKLSISSIDLEDIEKLNSIKLMLHNPVILSKLIWTTYFQKQTTEMCNRILGTNKICGIYKITNLKTKQCYVGQSVDVAQRWKDHVKCGLGIDASTTNKLYNSMQKDGVWNFSFELLTECSREKLDTEEKRWIGIYQSSEIGYNSNRGMGK